MRVPTTLILSASIVLGALILRPALQQRPLEQTPAPAAAPALSLASLFEGEWAVFGSVQSAPGEMRWTPELAVDLIGVAGDIDPAMGERLQSLWDADHAAFEASVRQTGQPLLTLVRLREGSSELYEIKIKELAEELEIARIAAELRAARAANDADAVIRLENTIQYRLQVQLALKIKDRFDYLCVVEGQVDALHDEIETIANDFNTTVDRRFEQLTGSPPPARD